MGCFIRSSSLLLAFLSLSLFHPFVSLAVSLAPSPSSSSFPHSLSPTSFHAVPPNIDYNCSALAQAGAFKPYILRNSAGMEARFIPYGATLTHLLFPDARGITRDVVLGFDDPTQYCANALHPYFGAAIGRVANRIANCSFDLEGQTYKLSCNENTNSSQPDTLHGGVLGYDRRVWTVEDFQPVQGYIVFSLFSPDGEMGFPGDLHITLRYDLTEDNRWRLSYNATAGSKDTVAALTQHSYWNLNGNANNTATVLEHLLYINADRVLAVDKDLVPTGGFVDVNNAAPWLDFSNAKAIGRDISKGTVTPKGGYDNAFIFNDWTPPSYSSPLSPSSQPSASSSTSAFPPALPLRVVMTSPLTNISLTLRTDQPSVQFYSGNFLDGTIPRKADQTTGTSPQYYQHFGTAVLEAQAYPDSVHHGNFPSVVVRAGTSYLQFTEYQFGTF